MQEIGDKLSVDTNRIMDKILTEQDHIIWESMGLTPDVQSMENAALLTKVSAPNSNCLHSKPTKNIVNWTSKY